MIKEIILGIIISILIILYINGFNILPFIFIGVAIYFLNYLLKDNKLIKNGNKSNKIILDTNFSEIGGQESAKNELKEALDFLNNTNKIKKLGIRPLKGFLLEGPPGTGKTLMAKAAAQYTDSTFIGVSGSEFIEMYAGVGAKRIRELFSNSRKKAKKEEKKSAVIFIDEIEILGGKRGKNSSHLEYDQTLNQLLVELDGLTIDDKIKILVIAATNRKDMLDKALLRPGRFDRIVSVNLPAKLDRLEILKIHTNNKPLSKSINLNKIASETFMFSGAHLESLANEAAILAMRKNKTKIEQKDFEEAIDKVIMGEKLNRKPKDKELKRIAIHEAGHALISELLIPNSVSTINISSRGKALGYVRHNEQEDILLKTRDDLYNEICIALAGALAEKLMLDDKSTGARNDYKKVIQLINKIISSGISDLGIINKEKIPENILYQEEKKMIKKLTNRVEYILRVNKDVLNKLSKLLLDEEKISGEKLKKLMNRENAKVNI